MTYNSNLTVPAGSAIPGSSAGTKLRSAVKIIIFTGLLAAIICGLTWLFTPKWNNPSIAVNSGPSIDGFRRLSGDDVQAFFVGTSHMEFGADPMRMYGQNGIVTYNLSTSGQPAAGTYFFIKEIFSEGFRPKVIAWDVSNLFIDSSGEAPYRYILDRTYPSENRRKLAEALLDEMEASGYDSSQMQKLELGIIFPLYKYHTRWDELDITDFQTDSSGYFSQGHMASSYMTGSGDTDETVEHYGELMADNTQLTESGWNDGEQFSDSRKVQGTYHADISQKNAEYLHMAKEICDTFGCRLLLVKIPVMRRAVWYSSSWTQMRHDAVQDLADSEGLDFIDLNYSGPEIDWEHDTTDGGSHLNVLGSEKVSDYLAEYLVSDCSVTASQNSGYDEKLEKYDAFHWAALLETCTDLKEYADLLNGAPEECDLSIYMAAMDDMSGSLNAEDILALRSLGLRTYFGAMEYNDSFIASIRNGEVLYECVSTRGQQYYENMSGSGGTVYSGDIDDGPRAHVTSSGYLDANTASIVLNGSEYSCNSRGLNIVVYDNESDIVLDSVVFDTFDSAHGSRHSHQDDLFKYKEYLMRN